MAGRVSFFSIHPSLILWLSLLFYIRPGLALPFLGSMAFHELGHVLALLLIKKPPRRLTLTFAGAQLETPPLGYRQTIWAAAGGPVFSLLLGLLLPLTPTLSLYSLTLGLFNLLPLSGLDGGKMLESFLLLHLPEEKAERLFRGVSLTVSGGLCLLAVVSAAKFQLGLWPILLAAVLLFKALDSGKG